MEEIVNEITAKELRDEDDSVLTDVDIKLINEIFEEIKNKKNKVIVNSDRNVSFKFKENSINVRKVVSYFERLGYVVDVRKTKPVTIENIHVINISWADLGWRDIDSTLNQ